MEDKKKQALNLLLLLSQGSTAKSQALLKKYGQEPAKNYDELASKLASLYSRTPDKITLEKEFVAIHPHKDLILKYTLPEKKEAVEAIEKLQVMTEKQQPVEVEVKEQKSNCGGCSMNKSGADGSSDDKDIITKMAMITNQRLLIGAGFIVVSLGLYLHYRRNSH